MHLPVSWYIVKDDCSDMQLQDFYDFVRLGAPGVPVAFRIRWMSGEDRERLQRALSAKLGARRTVTVVDDSLLVMPQSMSQLASPYAVAATAGVIFLTVYVALVVTLYEWT